VDRIELEDQAWKAFVALLSADFKTVIYKEICRNSDTICSGLYLFIGMSSSFTERFFSHSRWTNSSRSPHLRQRIKAQIKS